MPVVPANPQVRTAPVPGPALNVQSTPETFGAGVARGVGDVGDVAHRIQMDEIQKANEIALNDADNQYSAAETPVMTSALSKRGKDAIGTMPDDTMQALDKAASEIESNLHNGYQKQAFRMQAARRKAQANQRIQSHVAQEKFAYDTSEHKAALENSQNYAAQNINNPDGSGPDIVYGEVMNQTDLINKYAQRNSIGPNDLQAMKDRNISATYADAVRTLADGDDHAATQKYFESVKENILPSDRTVLDDLVKKVVVKGESKQISAHLALENDSYVAAKDALDAMDIKDDDVKEQAKKRLQTFYQEKAQKLELIQDARFEEVYTTLKKTGGNLDFISESTLESMDSRHREGIENLAEAIKLSTFPKNGSDTYFNFLRLAEDPALHDAFIKENVDIHRADMSPENFNYIKKLDIDIRAKKNGAGQQNQKVFAGMISETAVENSLLRSMDLDPERKIGSKDADPLVAGVQKQFSAAVTAKKNLEQRELTDQELEKISNDLFEKVAVEKVRSKLSPIGFARSLAFGGWGPGTYEEMVSKVLMPGAFNAAHTIEAVPAWFRTSSNEIYGQAHGGETAPNDYIMNEWNIRALKDGK